MNKTILVITILSILLMLSVPDVAFAQSNTSTVEGQPEISAKLTDNIVKPGEKNTVDINISNSKNISESGPSKFETNVSTVQNISVDLKTERSIDILSYDLSDKSIEPDESILVTVKLFVPEDALDQNLNINASYNYTNSITYNTTTNTATNSSETNKDEIKSFELETEDITRFSVAPNSNEIPVGETGINTVEIENTGDINVKNAELKIESKTSKLSFSGSGRATIDIGDIDKSDSETYDLRTTFSESASDTEYSAEGTITYEDRFGNSGSYSVSDINFNPQEDTEFSVEDVSSNASIGGSGILEVELQNVGDIDISDSRVKIESQSGLVTFGSNARQSIIDLGDWDEGNEKSFKSTIRFSEESTLTDYSLSTKIIYDNEDNIKNQESVNGVNVKPLEQVDIKSSIVDSNVIEGEQSTIEFKLTNVGPKDIENIKATFDGDEYLVLIKEQKNIERLDEGESTSFNIPVESPSGINSDTQNLDLNLEYEDSESDDVYTDSSLYSIDVKENNKSFGLEIVDNSSIEAGESKVITVEVENNQSSKISNIESEFSVSDPLSLSQESAYIDSLDGGEKETINVSVSVSSDSLINSYPLNADFEYKDEAGDSKLSEVYSVPIDVEEPTEQSSPTGLYGSFIIGLIAVLIIIYYRKSIKTKLKSIND